jgi:hypothetical protein
MKNWLIGNAILLSVVPVIGGTWLLLSFFFGPNVFGALASLIAGGLWLRWLIKTLNKREWDKALGRKT